MSWLGHWLEGELEELMLTRQTDSHHSGSATEQSRVQGIVTTGFLCCMCYAANQLKCIELGIYYLQVLICDRLCINRPFTAKH